MLTLVFLCLPQLRHLSYGKASFMLPADRSPCLALSQLSPRRDRLSNAAAVVLLQLWHRMTIARRQITAVRGFPRQSYFLQYLCTMQFSVQRTKITEALHENVYALPRASREHFVNNLSERKDLSDGVVVKNDKFYVQQTCAIGLKFFKSVKEWEIISPGCYRN